MSLFQRYDYVEFKMLDNGQGIYLDKAGNQISLTQDEMGEFTDLALRQWLKLFSDQENIIKYGNVDFQKTNKKLQYTCEFDLPK